MPSRNASIYQAKYGWNLRPVIFTGIFLVVCVVAIVEPGALWKRIVVVGIFGVLALLIGTTGLTRKTALRVDSSGVTLRQYPQQPRSAAFCPWGDVEKLLGYLTQSLTALLAFIGVKMLLAGVLHIPATVSLGVIVAIIATAVLLSAWQRRRRAGPAARPHDLHTGCAGPAPRPGVLEASTRQVAPEGGYQDAAPTAEATAPSAATAVAKEPLRWAGRPGLATRASGGRAGGISLSLYSCHAASARASDPPGQG